MSQNKETIELSKRKIFDGGSFFAGANSASGFVSFYNSIFEDKNIKKIYILKGGPGTGKSSFMKKTAEYARGRELSVEEYRCSSDPASLDGIVIGGRIAMIDGTPPHAVDPHLPGSREEIINLGVFWDDLSLERESMRISKLVEQKEDCYKKAYRYLSAYSNVSDLNASLSYQCLLEQKAKRSVDRIFSKLTVGGGFKVTCGMISSVGMRGRVRYDTYERFAKSLYLINDFYGLGSVYLGYLAEKAQNTDTPIYVSYDPIDCKTPDALFLPKDEAAFVIIPEGKQADNLQETLRTVINMKRFANNSNISAIRGEYRLNARLGDAFMGSALEWLEEAGKYHFELERLYVECMDFEAQNVFVANFLDSFFMRHFKK